MHVREIEKDLLLREATAKATYRLLKPREQVSFHHRNAIEAAYANADKG